jgi:hypothetical protein
MKERRKIERAFEDLRGRGVMAEDNYTCCQTCGHHELSEQSDNYVFWHEQDDAAFSGDDLAGTLNIRFSDGMTALATTTLLIKHGLSATWSGDMGKTIQVRGGEAHGPKHQ